MLLANFLFWKVHTLLAPSFFLLLQFFFSSPLCRFLVLVFVCVSIVSHFRFRFRAVAVAVAVVMMV